MRIAISQRFDQVPGRDEWRDGLDVQWSVLLESLGMTPVVLPSHLRDVAGYLSNLEVKGLILSGGNDIGSAPARDHTEAKALDYAEQNQLPVLGVCRGMQFLYYRAGGTLHTCSGHVATYHSIMGDWASEHRIKQVNSFHNQGFYQQSLEQECEGCFECLAVAKDGVVEAFRHIRKPWLGIMWHPEREVPFSDADLKLIKKHFSQQEH